MKQLSKTSKLILKNYSESASEAGEKLEVLDPMIKKLKEELGTEELKNFSIRTKSGLRKLLKKFSETEEAIQDAAYDADQLEEVAKEFGDKSVERKVKLIKKEFADLTNKFDEFKKEAEKVSEIAASSNQDVLSIGEGVAPAVATEDISDAKTDEKDSIGQAVPTDDADEVAARTDVKESINFSKFVKGKVSRLFVKFSEVVDSMENIVDLSEDLDESIKDEDKKEECEEDMKNFSIEEKLAPAGTYAEAIALTNFTEEITKKMVEVAEESDLGEDAKEKIEECFSKLGEALDEVCANYCDETANVAIEKIEECKECMEEFAKKCTKFSMKKKMNGIMKEFAQVDSMIDEVSEKALAAKDVACIPTEEAFAKFCEEIKDGKYTEEEVVEFCKQFCEATDMEVVPQEVKFADEELNECIDELDKVEQKIEDKKVVEFSQKLRTKLKSIVCFSQENLDAKAEVSGDLAEFLDEKAEEEFSEMDEIPANLKEADQELNEKIDELSEVEDKVMDEGIKNFAKKILKAMKSMKCFSQEDLDAKSDAVAEVSESLDQAIEDQGEKVDEAAPEEVESITEEKEEVTENFEACPECGAEPCECEKEEDEEVTEVESDDAEVEETEEVEFSEDADESDDDQEDEEVTEEVEEEVPATEESEEVPADEESEEVESEEEVVEEEEPIKSALIDFNDEYTEEEKVDESIINFSKSERAKKTSYASMLGL